MIEVEFNFASSSLRIGNAKKDQTVTKTVEMLIKDTQNTKITAIEPSSEFITVKELEDKNTADNKIQLEVTLSPGLPMGPIRESIIVRSNISDKSEAKLRLSGNIIGDIEVNPTTITYIVSDSAGIINGELKKLTIINRSSDLPLKLLEVSDPDGYVTIETVTITEDQKYVLNCVLKDDKFPESQRYNGHIAIKSNNPDEAEKLVDYKIIKRK